MRNFAYMQSDYSMLCVLSRIKFELKTHGFAYLLFCKSAFSAWKKKGLLCNTESLKYSLGLSSRYLFRTILRMLRKITRLRVKLAKLFKKNLMPKSNWLPNFQLYAWSRKLRATETASRSLRHGERRITLTFEISRAAVCPLLLFRAIRKRTKNGIPVSLALRANNRACHFRPVLL